MTDAAADLDVQSLRIVRAIADTGSITGAAAALGYSQPAISQHLRRLEARLEIAVVERVGRGVRLTEAGRVLARHAPTVALAVEAAAEELSRAIVEGEDAGAAAVAYDDSLRLLRRTYLTARYAALSREAEALSRAGEAEAALAKLAEASKFKEEMDD